jgi:hypothetical protein
MALPIRVATRKGPLDAASSSVAPSLQRRYLSGENSLVGSAARQALALQNPDLDLSDIQSAGMLGCVVELDPAQQRHSHLHAQHFFKALAHMRVEIVQHEVNLAHVRIAAAHQPADEGDEIHLSAPGGDLHEAALTTRLNGDKNIAGSPARSYS